MHTACIVAAQRKYRRPVNTVAQCATVFAGRLSLHERIFLEQFEPDVGLSSLSDWAAEQHVPNYAKQKSHMWLLYSQLRIPGILVKVNGDIQAIVVI